MSSHTPFWVAGIVGRHQGMLELYIFLNPYLRSEGDWLLKGEMIIQGTDLVNESMLGGMIISQISIRDSYH